MAKSKYAEELTKRGFERLGKHTMFQSLIQRYGKRGGPPSFTRGTSGLPLTFATDETHYSWMAKDNVDLSDLGFNEITDQVHDTIQALSSGKRRKMN